MVMLVGYILFIFLGCSLVWKTLDFSWIARSPFRIAIVGLLACGCGFFLQVQVHRSESIPEWILVKVPALAVDPELLGFLDKFVDVVVYSAGAGVIASALFLRAQLRFEKERKIHLQAADASERNIFDLRRDLKFVEADVRLTHRGTVRERRDVIMRVIDMERRVLDKSRKILKEMDGC